MRKYRSNAQWPPGTSKKAVSNNITSVICSSEAVATAAGELLEKNGIGVDTPIFPIRTWVVPL